MPSKELGHGRLASCTLRHGKNQVCEFILIHREPQLVEREKYDRGGGADSLVTVNERMIADDVKEIRGRHFTQIAVQKLPAE